MFSAAQNADRPARTAPWRRQLTRFAVAALAMPFMLAAGCSTSSASSAGPTTSRTTNSGAGSATPGPAGGTDVQKMIGGSGTGSPDFSDPYPVYRSHHGTSVADPHIVFGTPRAVLLCPGSVRPGCYSRRPITIQMAPAITAAATAAGTVIAANQNHNPFQSDDGSWHMALTVSVREKSQPPGKSHWSVVLHAHSVGPADPVPTTWVADSVLAGSLAHDEHANYDGKYYETDSALYLLYSKRLSDKPARDGVVAQSMTSPTQPGNSEPVVLLQPTPGAGFSSEDFFDNAPKSKFKLVETGNISQIGGKFVMAYSTGAFNENDYKVGLASSDTFLPGKDSTYQKLVTADPSNLWHNPSHQDVAYLMQSQHPQWIHYVGDKVQAPGVPSIVQDGHNWYLIFAGYPPDGSGDLASKDFNPAQRQPMLTPLCPSGTASIAEPCTR